MKTEELYLYDHEREVASITITDDAAELHLMPDISASVRDRISILFDNIDIIGDITKASTLYAAAGFILRRVPYTIEQSPETLLHVQAKFLHESNLIEEISEISYSDVAQGLLERKPSGCVGAWLYAQDLAEKRKLLSFDDICSMQRLIGDEQVIHGHPLPDKYRGAMRDCLVRVGNTVHEIPTKDVIDQFILSAEMDLQDLDPGDLDAVLRVAARQHFDFEFIHPFKDGNGRVGRLLVNYVLAYCGYKPLIFTHQDKHRYYRGFVDSHGVHETNSGEMERYFIEQYMSQHEVEGDLEA